MKQFLKLEKGKIILTLLITLYNYCGIDYFRLPKFIKNIIYTVMDPYLYGINFIIWAVKIIEIIMNLLIIYIIICLIFFVYNKVPEIKQFFRLTRKKYKLWVIIFVVCLILVLFLQYILKIDALFIKIYLGFKFWYVTIPSILQIVFWSYIITNIVFYISKARKRNILETKQTKQQKPRKNPILASLLNLILFGAGFWYLGQVKRMFKYWIVAFVVIFITAHYSYNLFLISWIGAYFLAVVQSYNTANLINKLRGYRETKLPNILRWIAGIVLLLISLNLVWSIFEWKRIVDDDIFTLVWLVAGLIIFPPTCKKLKPYFTKLYVKLFFKGNTEKYNKHKKENQEKLIAELSKPNTKPLSARES